MTRFTPLRAALLATLAACGPVAPDPDATTLETGATDDPTNPPTTTPPTTTPPTTSPPTSPTTDVPTTFVPTTDVPTTFVPTTDVPTTTDGPDTEGGEFVFAEDPYDAYAQLDRHGAPEAATAGIRAAAGLGFDPDADLSLRDSYNASDPNADAQGVWIGELADSLAFFHAILDDDLTSLGLTPATLDDSVAQWGPMIVPDAIKYDPNQPSAYPNGRRLEDPVVDILLAAVLLKLGPQQPLDLFSSLPLNPPANDVPFSPEFPFLAPPHLP